MCSVQGKYMKLELCHRTLQNFFQNHSHTVCLHAGWAKNGTFQMSWLCYCCLQCFSSFAYHFVNVFYE